MAPDLHCQAGPITPNAGLIVVDDEKCRQGGSLCDTVITIVPLMAEPLAGIYAGHDKSWLARTGSLVSLEDRPHSAIVYISSPFPSYSSQALSLVSSVSASLSVSKVVVSNNFKTFIAIKALEGRTILHDW